MSVYSTGPDPTPRDCREVYLSGCRKDGVYTIDPAWIYLRVTKVITHNYFSIL